MADGVCSPQELVQLARAGDLAALDRATRCFGDRLVAIGMRRCGNPEDAGDAVQTALLTAGEHLTEFRGDGSFEGWLARLVIRTCARMRRGRKNDASLHRTDLEPADAGPDPETLAGRTELAGRLGEALLVLPPTDRVVVLLAEGEGWKGPEIAEHLGLTHDAVRSRLSRARARLRRELAAA